jgi:hypothetical protein
VPRRAATPARFPGLGDGQEHTNDEPDPRLGGRTYVGLQVIWAIGASMVALAGARRARSCWRALAEACVQGLDRAPLMRAVRLRCRSLGSVRHGLVCTAGQGSQQAFDVLQTRRHQYAVLVVEITALRGPPRAFT